MYVCICYAVTDLQVDAAIRAGADSPEAVGEATGAGTSCGGCHNRICSRLTALTPRQLVTSRVGGSHVIALSA